MEIRKKMATIKTIEATAAQAVVEVRQIHFHQNGVGYGVVSKGSLEEGA